MTMQAELRRPLAVGSSSGRTAGVIALLLAFATVAALLVYAPDDVLSDADLNAYLTRQSPRMFSAWVLGTSAGLAWLVFVVLVHRLLTKTVAATLFLIAAAAGQAASWTGASLLTAPAAPDAEAMSLAVYTAFGEAGHLASAAGTAGVGLALIALAVATRSNNVLSPAVAWFTAACGVILIPAAVAGPVGIPLRLLWLVVAGSTLIVRSVRRTDRQRA